MNRLNHFLLLLSLALPLLTTACREKTNEPDTPKEPIEQPTEPAKEPNTIIMTVGPESVGQTIKLAIGTVDDQQPTFTGLTLNKAWVDFRKDANGNNNYNAAVVTCTVTAQEMRIKGDVDLFSCAIMDADVDVSAPIETLDLSGLAHLQTVFCFQNKLKMLNVQGCNELDFLSAIYNELTALDVSNLPLLRVLAVDHNQLTELNLSGCKALYGLDCTANQLTTLDTSDSPKLFMLKCGENELTQLDFTNNKELFRVYCYDNNIQNEQMQALINTLPVQSSQKQGGLYVYDITTNDRNVCNNSVVLSAYEKQWIVLYRASKQEKDGSIQSQFKPYQGKDKGEPQP